MSYYDEQRLNCHLTSSAVLSLLVEQIIYHLFWVICSSPLFLHCMLGSSSCPGQMLAVCSASSVQLSLVYAGGRCAVFHPAHRPAVRVFFLFFWGQETQQLHKEGQHPSSHLKAVRSMNHMSTFHSSRKQCQATSWTSCLPAVCCCFFD